MHTIPVRLLALGLFASAVALAPGSPQAAQAYDNCTAYIDSLPAVLSTQGTWCLRKDLSTALSDGAAVTVAANNVTIDCNHFKMGGLAAGNGTFATGILSSERHNVTVRHCNVRGFMSGVALAGGSGHLVEDNRFSGNTSRAIYVGGDGSVIQRNQVLDTGPGPAGPWTTGIHAAGSVDVLDNLVSGVSNPEWVVGIEFSALGGAGMESTIRGNRIRGLDSGAGAFGILALASRTMILENELLGPTGANRTAIDCSDNGRSAYRDNVVKGFYELNSPRCVDAGGNIFLP